VAGGLGFPAKGNLNTEISVGIHLPLDMLEASDCTYSWTHAIELVILLRLTDSLSI